MTVVRTAWALARRRAVYAIAVIAAVICGLSSLIMQELAYDQRDSYSVNAKIDRQETKRCRQNPSTRYCRDILSSSMRTAEEGFKLDTDQLGARAKPLQTPLGAVRYTQGLLLTLVGLTVLIVTVGVSIAADRERGRYLSAWHPTGRGRKGLLVAIVSSLLATLLVAGGAALGAFIAAALGRSLWPLSREPSTATLPSFGPVELTLPSITGLAAILAVALAFAVTAWLVQRVLAFLLAGTATAVAAAMLTGVLPAWAPLTQLPATNGTWLHNRGEVGLLWQWPVRPLDSGGFESSDWTALAESNPQTAAMIGLLLLLVLTALALPSAIKQPSK